MFSPLCGVLGVLLSAKVFAGDMRLKTGIDVILNVISAMVPQAGPLVAIYAWIDYAVAMAGDT